MPSKKILFVIVEGPSDDTALGLLLSKIFETNTVHIEIMHMDILADYGTTYSNVVKKITDCVKQYANNNHLGKSNFAEVIHITDTDGVYIKDDAILEDSQYKAFFYTTDNIIYKNKAKVIERNKHKRNNILRMLTCSAIWENIPYKLIFMSSSLDHVLYDKLNLTDEEKDKYSLEFAKKYEDNVNGFIDFITSSEFSLCDDYRTIFNKIRIL